MSNITFSHNQLEALSLAKENIIVSAGAGSGKTAVLVERLYRLFTQAKVAPSRVLVLTFTKLAAEEMKERIKRKVVENKADSQLLAAIDIADITTFDAFALKVVKKYGYHLNYDTNITNLDETIALNMLQQYVDALVDERFSVRDEKFLAFYEMYFRRDNLDGLNNVILKLHALTNLQVDPDNFLQNYLTTFYSPAFFTKLYQQLNEMIIYHLRSAASLIKQLENAPHIAKFEPFIALAGQLLTLEDLVAHEAKIVNIPVRNNRGGKYDADKETIELIKTHFATLETLKAYRSKSKLEEIFLEHKEYAAMLLTIYEAARAKLKQFQATFNVYTFSDFARLALNLVNLSAVKEQLKEQYEYILIDEYQDTSDLQEAFIHAISNNNVYQVGDIKQSIYAFRNANSELFAAKYSAYQQKEGGRALDLNDNYRSRPQVLASINTIFSEIMTRKYGGAHYQKDHIIGVGQTKYKKLEKEGVSYGLTVLNYQIAVGDVRKKPEIEAQIIINDIKQKIASGFLVSTNDFSSLRPVRYEDFTILVNKKVHFELFEKLFAVEGIPLVVEKDEKLTDQKVLIALRSALTLFDAYRHEQTPTTSKFRRAAASFLRSFVIEYSDQQLFDLFNPDPSPFASDIVLAKFYTLAKVYRHASPSVIARAIVHEFNFYEALYKLNDILVNTNTLTALLETIDNLAHYNFTVSDIIQMYSTKREDEEKGSIERFKTTTNAVKLMSIHASKGLEFPLVYYAGLDNRIKFPKEELTLTPHHGFVFKTEMGISFNFHSFLNDAKQTIISEQMRLLYVALTRAKEHMIIVQSSPEGKVLKPLAEAKTLKDILLAAPTYQKEGEDVSSLPLNFMLPRETKNVAPLYPLSFKQINVDIIEKEGQAPSVHVAPEILERGNLLHRYFEIFDFTTKDLSYIKAKSDILLLQKILSHDLFKYATNDNVYREYAYLDETSQTIKIIDCFIKEKDKITLLDFKLSDITNPLYVTQIKNYATFLTKAFNLPVQAYLVSINLGIIKEVNLDA